MCTYIYLYNYIRARGSAAPVGPAWLAPLLAMPAALTLPSELAWAEARLPSTRLLPPPSQCVTLPPAPPRPSTRLSLLGPLRTRKGNQANKTTMGPPPFFAVSMYRNESIQNGPLPFHPPAPSGLKLPLGVPREYL